MKIAIVGPGFTGAVFPLANYMCNKGHEVDCFFFTSSGLSAIESLDFDKTLSWKTLMLQIPTSNLLYNYLNKSVGVFIIPILRRHLKLEKLLVGLPSKWINRLKVKKFIDILLIKQYERVILIDQTDNDHQVGLALKKHHVKFITTYHEVLYNQQRDKIRDSVVNSLKLDVPVVVHCDDIRQLLIKLSGVEGIEKRLSVIRVGPFESLWQYGEGQTISGIGENYLLFIGRIIPYKGVGILYEAIERLKEKYDLTVVIAGVGNDPILDRLKSDGHYTLINRFIENDEMVWLTKNCRAVVCPYIAASQSGMIPLSMAFGKPIIATSVGAFPEVIEEGKNGYLAKAGDIDDFARAIEKCINNEKTFVSGYVPERLKWDYIANQYLALLETL